MLLFRRHRMEQSEREGISSIINSKRTLPVLIFLQGVILVLIIAYLIFKGVNGYEELEVDLSKFVSIFMDYGVDGWHMRNTQKGFVTRDTEKVLVGNLGILTTGDYTLMVDYDSEQDCYASFDTSNGEWEYVKSGTAILPHGQTHLSYDFVVQADITKNLELIFDAPYSSGLHVENVRVLRNGNGIKRVLFLLFVVFLLTDLIIWKREWIKKNKLLLLGLSATVFLAVLPMLVYGIHSGHDLRDHLCRIDTILQEMRCLHFPPRILSARRACYGEAISVFYGDLFLYFPVFLRFMGFTLTTAYKCYLLLVAVVTVVAAYLSFTRIMKDPKLGLLLSFVYTLSTYRLTDVYVRSAVGEYTALMFYPLVALAMYRIYESEWDLKSCVKNAILLSLPMSGIVCSHVLSTVIVTVVLFLVCLVLIRRTLKPPVFVSLLLAVLFTILESCFFVVPFLDYYFNVSVNMTYPITHYRIIQDWGLFFGELFAFFRQPLGGIDANVAGRMTCSPGPVLMGAVIAALLITVLGKANKKIAFFTLFTLFLFYIATVYFPWNWLCQKVPVVNFIAQIQFPYRFMGPALIFMTLLLGYECQILKECLGDKITNVAIGCIAVLGTVSALVYISLLYDGYLVINFRSMEEINTLELPMDYTRVNTFSEPQDYDGKVWGENLLTVFESYRNGTDRDYYVRTGKKSGVMEMPVVNYKGYHVYDDRGYEYVIRDGDYDLVSIDLPAGFDGTIHLRFIEPWYWRVSEAVSVISWILVALFLIRSRKPKEQEKAVLE